MRPQILLMASAMLALAGCGGEEGNSVGKGGADAMAMENGGQPADNMNAPAAPATPQTATDYVDQAAAGDMYEIESAQLAQGKARSAEVKALAAMILKDHQKSTADLKASAAKANPPIDVAGILDTDQASNLGRLRNAAAEDFDALYLQQQIEAHEKSLAMVRSYAASGDQPSLKQHAAAGAGPIEAHLNRAKELSANSGH